MLLELLNHHEDLFLAAIRPLIGTRRTADLAALAASCRQLRLFIAELPFYKHYKLLCSSLKAVKSMNTLSNKHCSIKEYNNDLHIFRYKSVISTNTRFASMIDDEYYIRTIKARILYYIRCSSKIEITEINDIDRLTICIDGPIPLWVSKYPINIENHAVPCYTFTIS
jgi:hypothetical protein